MSSESSAETIETHGCSVVLRRVEGPEGRELFLLAQPLADPRDPGLQAEALYRAILGVLEAEGGSFASVTQERVFLRALHTNLAPVRAARARVLEALRGDSWHRPARSEVEQPPLDAEACLVVSVTALCPRESPLRTELVEATSDCRCAECSRASGLLVHVGEEVQLHAGGLCGAGEGAFEQTLAMFTAAEDMLARVGMDFRDVARTWIQLREIDRDYADLNRARRRFFESRGIDPPPASTGIGGGPPSDEHALSLSLYALRGHRTTPQSVMSASTLNDAADYGADFTRGLRVVEANKVALHVSGTASIDEAGRTAHPADLDAQVERMLVNVAALLEGQGASFRDVVSAVTYLKRSEDAERLRERLREARFEGFPNVLVEAPICRPELLCETEVLAALPLPRPSFAAIGPRKRSI